MYQVQERLLETKFVLFITLILILKSLFTTNTSVFSETRQTKYSAYMPGFWVGFFRCLFFLSGLANSTFYCLLKLVYLNLCIFYPEGLTLINNIYDVLLKSFNNLNP